MRHADKPCVEVELFIDAPAERIWPLVTDIGLIARVSDELQSAEWADGDHRTVGSTFVGTNRNQYFGEWQTTSTVVESDEPHVFGWAVGDVAEPNTAWRFRLHADGAGTLVRQWVQLGPGPSGITVAIQRQPDKEERIVERRLEQFRTSMLTNLAEIKRLAEDGSAQGAGAGLMRTATTVEFGTGWRETVDFVVEAERLGLDVCWVAEAWGADAPSPLGYLAARTSRMQLGSGVIQVGTRTPVAVAMTALTLAQLSEGRFLLGLGSSGPQVIEGLHGVAFARPLTRMRETIDVIRAACRGERIDVVGETVIIPLPDGEGVPMRLRIEPNTSIPLYIASLSARMLRLTGELADGWLGTSFVPEGAHAYFDPLREGAESAHRTLADLDVCQGAEVAFARDEDELATMVAARKTELAFSLGGMGSADSNFYNDAYSRQGWAEVAAEVRRLWLSGQRDTAASLVTDEMVLATTLIGTEQMVRDRLGVWRAAGVDTVRLYPAGETLDERVTTLGRALDLVRDLDRSTGSG